ncbi:hypothetical protein B566_EDAN009037 [Ephemera danica]|nr:hypothetical protein B566_EDAN009037 [Ephemera danica]
MFFNFNFTSVILQISIGQLTLYKLRYFYRENRQLMLTLNNLISALPRQLHTKLSILARVLQISSFCQQLYDFPGTFLLVDLEFAETSCDPEHSIVCPDFIAEFRARSYVDVHFLERVNVGLPAFHLGLELRCTATHSISSQKSTI